MIPIVENYCQLIKTGMEVLEIGSGSWDAVKCHCERIGASYEGIDAHTEYFSQKVVATRIENLADLSFPDGKFDCVIGTQSMEHWPEFGCSLGWGLFQCFRVLKPFGRLMLNVPIHFHGARTFLLGEIGEIQKLFKPFSKQISFENWGLPSDPLPPLFSHQEYLPLHNKPVFILDIQAVKDRPMPQGYSNRWAFGGYLGILMNYPLTYNFYRCQKKLRHEGLLSLIKRFLKPNPIG